jgi:serine/threonine protein kinase
MSQNRERFEFKKPALGGGAFGLVYLAYDSTLDQQVAVKIPHDSEKEQALRKEAKLMAEIRKLQEPHLVQLYDLHEIDGRSVIVMEYVDGQSLRAKLGSVGYQTPLDPLEALEIAIQSCIGLGAIHSSFRRVENSGGIFHRDIKPENIIIRNVDGVVKIADFGIAVVLEHSGLASTTTGTLPYMAPELLEGSGADYRADIYGLGVTLYEMLCGRLPFNPFDEFGRPKAPLVYGREICEGNALAPSEFAGIDDELSLVVLKAIHRKPKKRFRTMMEFRAALESIHSRLVIIKTINAAWKTVDQSTIEESLRDVIKKFPEKQEGYRNLGWFLNKQGRYAETMRLLEEGKIKCTLCGELLFDLAQVYHKTGDWHRAVETLKAAQSESLPNHMAQQCSLLLRVWKNSGKEKC